MKVRNMTSSKGNKVANQFIISRYTDEHELGEETFQSYNATIATKVYDLDDTVSQIYLDKVYWNYSVTTGKYRNIFLGETKKETEAKIKSGEYILTDLN